MPKLGVPIKSTICVNLISLRIMFLVMFVFRLSKCSNYEKSSDFENAQTMNPHRARTIPWRWLDVGDPLWQRQIQKEKKTTNIKRKNLQQMLPTFASLEVTLPARRVDRVNFVARHDFLYQLKLSWVLGYISKMDKVLTKMDTWHFCCCCVRWFSLSTHILLKFRVSGD